MTDFFKAYGSYVCLAVPAFFYLGQAAWYALAQGKTGLPLTFAAYAIANVGFILDTKGL